MKLPALTCGVYGSRDNASVRYGGVYGMGVDAPTL
jgi:hypothetical protein